MTQNRQRKGFTDEFKNDAIKLVIEQGYSCLEVSRRLGIHHTNISRWVRQYRQELEYSAKNPSASLHELEQENKRLKKENKRLLMEREILKKAAAFFANESK